MVADYKGQIKINGIKIGIIRGYAAQATTPLPPQHNYAHIGQRRLVLGNCGRVGGTNSGANINK